MSPELCVRSPSAEETQRLGTALGELLTAGDVIALTGELGSGKTCLVQGIARGLGVEAGVPITSPTFTLIGEYPARVPLRHADFYRVESYARLDDAGFGDLLDGRGVLIVEWPERFPEALPAERLEIRIEFQGDSSRRLCFEAHGQRATEIERRLLQSWA